MANSNFDYEKENLILVQKIQSGIDKKDNLEKLLNVNEKLLNRVCDKYSVVEENDSEIQNDIYQSAYIGLHNATLTYKAEYDVTFAHYAVTCMRREITRYIRNNRTSVRLPEYLHLKIYDYKKFKEKYYMKFGKEPEGKELLDFLHINGEELKKIEYAVNCENISSLDKTIEGQDAEIGTILEAIPNNENIEFDVLERIENDYFWNAVYNRLDEIEQKYLYLYYFKELPRKRIGELLNIKESEVNTIAKNTIRKLRYGPGRKEIKEKYKNSIFFHNTNCYRGNGLVTWKYSDESNVERLAFRLAGVKRDED